MKIISLLPIAVIELFILFFSLCIVNIQRSEAVEPDSLLYSANAAERDAAYTDKTQQLSEKIATTINNKEKQKLLLQQQLLVKLQELPDKPEKPSMDLRFSESVNHQTLSWLEAEQHLERYLNVQKEEKIAAQNLDNTKKQMQALNFNPREGSTTN